MAISRTSLAQSAEALRKLRNSARFILGNAGNYQARESVISLKDKLSLVSLSSVIGTPTDPGSSWTVTSFMSCLHLKWRHSRPTVYSISPKVRRRHRYRGQP